MKNFENLGNQISKSKMKLIIGGVYDEPVQTLVGWRLDENGNCWCDFCQATLYGEPFMCNQSCPVTMCTTGSIDYNAWCIN